MQAVNAKTIDPEDSGLLIKMSHKEAMVVMMLAGNVVGPYSSCREDASQVYQELHAFYPGSPNLISKACVMRDAADDLRSTYLIAQGAEL